MSTDPLREAERLTFEAAVDCAVTVERLAAAYGDYDAVVCLERGQLRGLIRALFFMTGEPNEYAHQVVEAGVREAAAERAKARPR